MEAKELNATARGLIGKQVKALRREGKLPAVIYGRGIEPTPILMDLKETSIILSGLPSSALVTLVVDGKRHMALVREKQRDYIRGTLKHIDFQAVSAKEKIRVPVSIELTGESPAVKDLNAILVVSMEQVHIECLPSDLIDSIPVDISGLKAFGDALHVRDLHVPEAVHILDQMDEMIVVVTTPAAEEVVEVAEPGEGEPEVIEKSKKEEEEGAE